MPRQCGVYRVDRIVVHKSRREMLLLSGESVVRSYRVALGQDPIGPKEREGDGRTALTEEYGGEYAVRHSERLRTRKPRLPITT